MMIADIMMESSSSSSSSSSGSSSSDSSSSDDDSSSDVYPDMSQLAALPNELWIKSFSFLNQKDLSSLARLSRNFYEMSSSDSLWEAQCQRRWKGKQNTNRFIYEKVEDPIQYELYGTNTDTLFCCAKSILCFSPTVINQRENCFADPPRIKLYLNLPAINMSLPPSQGGSTRTNYYVMHQPTSFKEAFILAEIDSRRVIMAKEELVHFNWQLIYDGSPSQMGLRKFNADGTYWSPYMGMCEWALREDHIMFAGMQLSVERADNWGWVIGKGTRTVYHSIDTCSHTNENDSDEQNSSSDSSSSSDGSSIDSSEVRANRGAAANIQVHMGSYRF